MFLRLVQRGFKGFLYFLREFYVFNGFLRGLRDFYMFKGFLCF